MDQRQAAIATQLDDLVGRFLEAAPPETAEGRVPLSTVPFGPAEIRAALRTMLTMWISQGPKVREFERGFADYVGVEHGIAVNSGSSANLVALNALIEAGRLRPGDEVIVPATTFPTVASPVIQLGCIPVYADIDPGTYDLDPDAVERAIGPKTRAIITVHTLGYPADMPRIVEIAKRRGLILMEDCCEAHGSTINGKHVGSYGDIATCSFFVAHNMTTGEGGMVLTNDANLAAICRSLREFGRVDQTNVAQDRWSDDEVLSGYDKRYLFDRLGYNVRMTDITASFGVEQLRRLDVMNARRIENAAYYTSHLRAFGDRLRLPVIAPGFTHTYYTYPVAASSDRGIERGPLVRHLEAAGVETRPIFAGCLPDQPAFRKQPGRVAGPLTGARRVRDEAFFFGVHPGLRDAQLAQVVQAFETYFSRYQSAVR